MYGLHEGIKGYHSSMRDSVTAILVCTADYTWEPKVYAIKIKDYGKFRTKIYGFLNDPRYSGWTLNNILSDLNNNRLGFDYESSNSNYERAFLEFFKDCGIGLYELDDQLTDWREISLPGGQYLSIEEELVRTPCN